MLSRIDIQRSYCKIIKLYNNTSVKLQINITKTFANSATKTSQLTPENRYNNSKRSSKLFGLELPPSETDAFNSQHRAIILIPIVKFIASQHRNQHILQPECEPEAYPN